VEGTSKDLVAEVVDGATATGARPQLRLSHPSPSLLHAAIEDCCVRLLPVLAPNVSREADSGWLGVNFN
jgi:hypothetical protein